MTTSTTSTRAGTYQMLWDCPVCGTRKLLGVDHRHCPNCGAPQEENLRYFPSKSDRVTTDFRGTEPDWECRHCGTPTGSDAGFCAGCGAPRGDSASVHVRDSIASDLGETGDQAQSDWDQRRADQFAARVREQGQTEAEFEPEFRSRWHPIVVLTRLRTWLAGGLDHPKRLLGLGLGLGLMALLFLAVCDRQVTLRVTGHSWSRVIPVERYTTVSGSGWCDSIPGDARVSSRSSQVHHYDHIPDGEDCRTVSGSCSQSCSNVDHGNGSFSEVCTETCSSDREECTTRYRDEPVYADMCSYTVDRWLAVRQVERSGVDRSPIWPADPPFSGCDAARIGCERIGARIATYLVHYVDEGSGHPPDVYACPWPQPTWEATLVGAVFTGEVSRLRGKLDCEDVIPAERR